MYNEYLAIESFISYCDDMMIAEEGITGNIKLAGEKFGILLKLYLKR